MFQGHKEGDQEECYSAPILDTASETLLDAFILEGKTQNWLLQDKIRFKRHCLNQNYSEYFHHLLIIKMTHIASHKSSEIYDFKDIFHSNVKSLQLMKYANILLRLVLLSLKVPVMSKQLMFFSHRASQRAAIPL